MKNKHTPGPWEVASCPESGPYIREVPSYKIRSWPVPETIIGELSNEADANLIAAAPEMYEALKTYIRLIDEFKTLVDQDAKRHLIDTQLAHHTDVRLLIAKIRGEQ